MPENPNLVSPYTMENKKGDPPAMPFGTMSDPMPFMGDPMIFGGQHFFHHHFHHHFFHPFFPFGFGFSPFGFGFSPFMFGGFRSGGMT